MVWTNARAIVYHGTLLASANGIISLSQRLGSNGVDLTFCRGIADFGRGFYVTTVLHQAEQWANQKVRNLPMGVNDAAAVLTFEMDRDVAGACGDHIAFVMADPAFHDFVLYNRLNGANHYRQVRPPRGYDIVYGPLVAFPQTMTFANCDQICFLTPKAVASLHLHRQNPSQGNPFFP